MTQVFRTVVLCAASLIFIASIVSTLPAPTRFQVASVGVVK